MDDIESFSSDEEETEAEGEDVKQTKETPSASPEDPSEPPISPKCTHESSTSDSNKESPPSAHNSVQAVPAHLLHNSWVKVSEKKWKKCRMEAPTHSG